MPPAFADHMPLSPSSPRCSRISFVVFTPASCAARISSVEVGVGAVSPLNFVSSSGPSGETPGSPAMCRASTPSDIDFGCGFHSSLSAGTRSRTRRVVAASFSNSWRNAAVTDIELTSPDGVNAQSLSLILAREVSVGPVNPVLSHRAEHVDDDRVFEHGDRMRDAAGNLHDFARADDDLALVELELERTAEDAADLLVFVRVPRDDAAALELETGDSDAVPGEVPCGRLIQ